MNLDKYVRNSNPFQIPTWWLDKTALALDLEELPNVTASYTSKQGFQVVKVIPEGKRYLWEATRNAVIWVVAELIDNHFQNHREYSEDQLDIALDDVLK